MPIELERLADHLAIRELLDEYCLRLELDDFEQWLALFTEDAVYEVFGRTLRGREQIGEVLARAPRGLHLGGPVRIALAGDRAETVQSYLFLADDERRSNRGWYHRTLVRTAGGWRIARVRVALHQPLSPERSPLEP